MLKHCAGGVGTSEDEIGGAPIAVASGEVGQEAVDLLPRKERLSGAAVVKQVDAKLVVPPPPSGPSLYCSFVGCLRRAEVPTRFIGHGEGGVGLVGVRVASEGVAGGPHGLVVTAG